MPEISYINLIGFDLDYNDDKKEKVINKRLSNNYNVLTYKISSFLATDTNTNWVAKCKGGYFWTFSKYTNS